MADRMGDDAYQAFKDKHPEGTVRVETVFGTTVFRSPTRMEYKRFTALLTQDKTKADALEWLSRTTVIHPERLIYEEWIEKKPGIPTTVCDAIIKLAGVQADADSKE